MRIAVAQQVPFQWNQDRMIQILRAIETQLNLLSEGRIAGRHFTAAAAPTAGDFARGDIVWNSAPEAAGTVGWICVTGGSPGTFKAFGTIAA